VAYDTELNMALTYAKEAGNVQLSFQRNSLTFERKSDFSPVTEVDKKCEEIIRDGLLSKFPSDGFLGEETGNHTGNSSRRWIVDPLDGTRPFIRGIPTFSTLIALEEDGEIRVGVIHLPALKITCWASWGGGAFENGSKIHVSNTSSLSEATGSALGFLQKSEEQSGVQLLQLMKSLDYIYGFMDAFTYVCVATGRLDCAVNLLDKAWDCAAAACIITEAGGTYTDISSKKTVHSGSIIFSNGVLDKQLLHFFS
jgi:histidinol phosphatase-like enzyme (inositol monophosphatase family)